MAPRQKVQLNSDAKEFGIGVRCGGWRLGLLVARNVEARAGQGKRNDLTSGTGAGSELSKVSPAKFAELAGEGVSERTVRYYLQAWNLAAQAGLVPAADTIVFGDDEVDVVAENIESEDDPRTHWTHFYKMAKNPPEKAKKPEKKEDSKPKPEKEIDQDFGLSEDAEPEMTEDERAEADSQILRNELLEVLESVRAVESRLTRIGSVPDDKDGLLGQIASAALDISTMATAMTAVSEKVEA